MKKIGNRHRDPSIDGLKGILILLVVLGHGISLTRFENGILNSLIYAVHMPAFFVVSGYLHNQDKWEERGFGAFVWRRIRTILIPYIILDVFCGCVKSILAGSWFGLNAVGILHELLIVITRTLTLDYWSAPSWFLPVLFTAEMMLYIILSAARKTGSRKNAFIVMTAVSLLIFAAVLLFYKNPLNRVMHLLITACLAYLFLCAGYCGWHLQDKELRPAVYIVLAVIVCLCAFYNQKALHGSLQIRSVVVYIIGGICGSVLLFRLAWLIESWHLARLGRKSLPIYGTHYLIRDIIKNSSYFAKPVSLPGFLIYLAGVFLVEALLVPILDPLFRMISGKM